ncbi:MAG TPA: undecaprenyl-diphosphate phosphatase, partial [Cytophagaceae bacterium]
VLIFMDKWFSKNEVYPEDEITYKKAFTIGAFQTIAMIPGVSRSAATIFGGLSQKLSRKVAAEFSFFLAVPTMFAATAKSLYDDRELLLDANISILLFGNVIAFIVAILAIKFFIGFLNKYGFKIFGYYRIIIGLILIVLLASGTDLTIVD